MRDNNIYKYGEQQLGYFGYTDTLAQNAANYQVDLDKGPKPVEEVDLADSQICLDKDWNAEFQACLETADGVEKFKKLSNLARDFSYAAKVYGSIIINEYYLSSEKKTIKPVVIGGIAGGHKYVVLGILFKFALDTKGLYGGDANAMKAAAHELKGLMSYYNCHVTKLHVPLMAIIDYHGFRLLAVSVLPINKIIVYGSRDAGKTVHALNPEMNTLMKSAAARMNLKEHLVGKEKVALHSCGDIEGHMGKDSRFYLLDFARVFPPQYRLTSVGPPSHLFCLLRPELVKSNPVALCSDALTGWVLSDPQHNVHNKEVKEATSRLLHSVVPKFARWLDEYMEENSMAFPNKKNRPILADFIEELHRRGINVRHLGFVVHQVRYAPMRTALLTEMIARIMKCLILEQFREKMQERKIPCEEPYKETVASFLNLVISRDSLSPQSGHFFWGEHLQQKIIQKFSVDYGTLSIRGEDPNREEIFGSAAQKRVDLWLLVKRFLVLTGITLTRSAKVDLKESMGNFLLHQDDIEAITGKCKFMNIIEHASGMVLFAEAQQRPHKEAKRLFALASSRFRAALATFPLSVGTLYQWAKMLTTMAARSEDAAETTGFFKEAEEKLRYVLEIVPDYLDAKNALVLLLYKYGCHLLVDHKPELSDKLARQSELMLAEALSLDVSELGERCGVYNDLSADAMAFALNTTKECTFKLERNAFIAAHTRFKALESFQSVVDCEARKRPVLVRHIKLLIQHHSSCLSHNRGDLAAGLMAYTAACLKRVHPDSDLYNYFQGTHTKWQLVTMFLLSREAPSEDYIAPIIQRLQILTSFSLKIKSLPPSLLGRTIYGEAPLANLLDILRHVRFLVLDSMPISDAIMAFLFFNFEHLDSLSVSGCKDITFIAPTSYSYNKANSRALLQPPLLPPITDTSSPLPPLSEFAIIREEYDNRSLNSSGSSTYSGISGINPYDDISIRSDTSSNSHFRPVSPPVRGNSFYDDTSSDCSSPPLSPRNSITLDTSNYSTLRGATPPPELKVFEAGSGSPRSALHSGHRSNSDGSSTPPLTKLKRSSSNAETPNGLVNNNRRSGGASPASPNLIRGGSWDKSARSPHAMIRSGSEDLGRSYSLEYSSASGSDYSISASYSFHSNASAHSDDTSPTSPSTNSLNSSGSHIISSPNTTNNSSSPVLQRAGKRLNIIGMGRNNSEPMTMTSPEMGSSSRARHSLKLFSLSRSGGSETSSDSNALSPPSTPSTSTSPNRNNINTDGKPKNEQKFSELQFLNCSNCTSLVDKSLQAIALQKLPLQCLYLSGCARISDAGVIPLFTACPQLKVLEINDCYKITDAAILELAKNCTELKELNVASCKVTASSIERVAKSCTNLVSLNISGVESITDNTVKVISQRCPNMHILMLGHCPNITDASIFFIASKLASSIQVLTINNGVKITDTSVTALGNACSSLRTLKLRNSTVSHNSVIGLIQSNTMLSRLDLFGSHQLGSPIFDSLLTSGQTLRVLKIAQCYGISNTIAFADPYELFASKSGLRNLTTLDWTDTNLTNKVLENVCTHCKKLTKLKLQGCKLITNQAMGFIAKTLVSLQKLRIDRCPQIDDGGIVLLSSESTARNLTTLSLIRVAISNHSIEALSKFESLQNLHLSNSGNLTPDAVAKMLRSCIELQQVYLVLQNANTETNRFMELKQKFPRVKLYFVESGGRKYLC